jgi:hypothetical protein
MFFHNYNEVSKNSTIFKKGAEKFHPLPIDGITEAYIFKVHMVPSSVAPELSV